MRQNKTNYDYYDIEQAKMARDIIKEVIDQHGKVLRQRNYFQYLETYIDLLCKDLPEDDEYYD
jgi:hypothetical protein